MSKEGENNDRRDDLARLRRENNRLRRELAEQQRLMSNASARADEVETRLRREVADIKHSRAWQTALLLIQARRRLTAAGIREWLQTKPAAAADDAPGDDLRARRYQAFVAGHALTAARRRRIEEALAAMKARPLMSIVIPVYNVEPAFLNAAVNSVRGQIYPDWELCVVDDASTRADTVKALDELDDERIRMARLGENLDIAGATDHGISMTRGDYVLFLDHDDQLAADALAEVALEIERSGADFIYTDEDYIDAGGRRGNPHFKPDFSPDLLLSHNYITHLVAVKRDLLERIGGLRSDFDGAQDYDFVLRATEQAQRIGHIPRVLYHWRMSETSTSVNAGSKPRALERGRLALNEALTRRGREGVAVVDPVAPHFYRVRYTLRTRPRISILIPFRDQPDLLHCAVGDILELSTYDNYEILGIDNGSDQEATRDAIRDLAAMDDRVRFIDYDRPFSFSAVMNHGAAASAGEHLVFLNNDVRVITAEWLEAMLEHSQRDDVGAVGGKLYYPDGRVQHAGIIVGIGGYAGHAHKGFAGDHQGYFNRLRVIQNVSAVTGAFMMIGRVKFDAVGGFDEDNFAVACNDVDLCLRLRAHGLWNIFTPYAEGFHIESASRGYEDSPEKRQRFAGESARFAERHHDILERGDPFYNPNLTVEAEDFSVRVDRPAS